MQGTEYNGGGAAHDPGAQGTEVVTTIHVSHLPGRLQETEFNLMFLFAPGFEQACLHASPNPNSQSGWARFSTQDQAEAAIGFLNGLQLTPYQAPECPTLQACMARKQFRPGPTRKRTRDEAFDPTGRRPAGSFFPPGAVAGGSGSTLYIRNISAVSTAECMQQVLQTFDGYETMKFDAAQGDQSGRCWAKFASAHHAAQALPLLAGHALPSAPDVALDAQFARNDLNQLSNARRMGGMGAMGGMGGMGAMGGMMGGLPPGMPTQAAIGAGPMGGTRAGANPPCDTMYLGNIAQGVTQEEVDSVFSQLPGYVKNKFVPNPPKGMAFVLFNTAEECQQAITMVHNTCFPSAPHQTVCAQFAKNSLDKNSR